MMRKQKHLYTLLCRLVVSLLLPFTLQAQSLPTKGNPGEAVEASLTVYNSIVWENVFESAEPSDGSHNLVSEDPLFASATDFFLQTSSPAIGAGDNSKNPLGVDIAGVTHAPQINIGAYENTATFTITIQSPASSEGTLAVYQGTTQVKDGDEFPAGTELKVTAIPAEGYRLEGLTANSGAIVNGEVYILTANTTFAAVLKQGNGRPIAFATAKDGSGKFNVYNTIIYGNADDYGTYSLDKTNVVANPEFASATEFALQPTSPALGNGDAAKLPAGSSDLAGVGITATGAIDAGAYQSNVYTLGWSADPIGGGTLEVFYLVENEAKQKVREVATNGGSYLPTTIVIKVTLSTGYMLQEIKAGDQVLTVTKGETSFELGTNTVITATFRSLAGAGQMATVYQPDGATMLLKNNIVYGNITVTDKGEYKSNTFAESPVAANIADDQNHLDSEDPMFGSATDFRLKTGSPAIDKGDNSQVTTEMKDLAGNERLYNNGTVDLGAYEAMEESTFIVTFGWTDLKDKYGKVYAEVTVTANGSVIASGDEVAAGSEISIAYNILNNDNYEWFGQVGLTGVGTNYLPEGVTTFTLEEDTRISVPIRLKKYVVTYEATNGGVKVYSGSTLIPNGEEVSYETMLTILPTANAYHKLAFVAVNGQHIEGAETAGGYIVAVTGETTITVNCVPEYELDADGDPVKEDPLGPDDDTNWKPAIVKGLLTWDALNAIVTVTHKADGSFVQSGEQLTAGTVVHVEIEPAATSGYSLVLIEVNGVSHPYTSFDLTIPEASAGAIKPTFIGVRYEATGIGEQPQPGSHQIIQTVTGNGTLTVLNGSSPVASGVKVASGTSLTVQATPASGYILSSLTINGQMTLSGSSFTVAEATTVAAVFEKEGVPTTPPTATDKKVTVTVMGSGTVTLKDAATSNAILSGEWVALNTSVQVQATAASGYRLTSLQVNGADITGGQFTVTDNSAVVAVFDRQDDTPTPPVTPPVNPNPGTEYVTLTIGGDLPAGVTINPGAGSYQIAKGSNQALTITVDSRYDGQYVYMKLNDRYVLLRDAGTQSTLTYTLVNITGSMSIGVVVSETPDLDPDNPSSNVEIRDGSEIRTESGHVCIRTDVPVTVRIVTFNGRVQVQQNLPAGETRIQLSDGFYIVVLSDGTTKKIAVRNF